MQIKGNIDEKRKNELLKEYELTQQMAIHYDQMNWQIGSILIACILIGVVAIHKDIHSYFLLSTLSLFVLWIWSKFYFRHKGIQNLKFERLQQIEKELNFKQHLIVKQSDQEGSLQGLHGKNLVNIITYGIPSLLLFIYIINEFFNHLGLFRSLMNSITFANFLTSYVAPLIPIIVALAVYFFGKSAYFRQKEYELITKRYLEEGVDAISKDVDRSLASFRHNWWLSTVVLKHFRELGKDIRPELLDPYIIPDTSLFELWRDYRLIELFRDDICFKVHQSLDAFVRTSYAFFQDDLGSMVRLSVKSGNEIEVTASLEQREQIVDRYFIEVEKLNQKAKRYYALLVELQNVSSLIQTERFSFKKLKKLYARSEIKRAIRVLKDLFPDLESEETSIKNSS